MLRYSAKQIGLETYPTNIVPMDRMAQPEEIASVAEFLLSEGSSYINGAAYTVDGGWAC